MKIVVPLCGWATKLSQERVGGGHVSTIDEAIIQIEALTNFRRDKHDKSKVKDRRSCHAKGRGDRNNSRTPKIMTSISSMIEVRIPKLHREKCVYNEGSCLLHVWWTVRLCNVL